MTTAIPLASDGALNAVTPGLVVSVGLLAAFVLLVAVWLVRWSIADARTNRALRAAGIDPRLRHRYQQSSDGSWVPLVGSGDPTSEVVYGSWDSGDSGSDSGGDGD